MEAKIKMKPDVGFRLIRELGVRRVGPKFIYRIFNISTGAVRARDLAVCRGDQPGAAPAGMIDAHAIAWSILVGAVLCLPRAAVSDSVPAHSKFVGVYVSHGGKKDPFMNVSLGADGTATVMEDPGDVPVTLFGRWVDSGSQLTVTFNTVEGQRAEPPMTFQPIHDGLQAVTWNHATWGKVTPPEMKKGSKMKQTYWFTTVR